MTVSAEIQDVELLPNTFVNSKRATYTFTIVPSITFKQSMLILIKFPEQIIVPDDDQQIICSST
jgi:hypothetical protein